MFSDMGKKIRLLAMVLCWTGIAISIIGALVVFCYLYAYTQVDMVTCIVLGAAILVCGPILSWVGSFVLCGYGELIEKTAQTAKNTEILKNLALQDAKDRELARREKAKNEGKSEHNPFVKPASCANAFVQPIACPTVFATKPENTVVHTEEAVTQIEEVVVQADEAVDELIVESEN